MNTKKISIIHKYDAKIIEKLDDIAIEEPLEIRLVFYDKGKKIQKSISTTMRTPGNDKELVIGFLFTEGIIEKIEDIENVQYCGPVLEDAISRNIMRVELQPEIEVSKKYTERNSYTSSSCGICGKTSLDALHTTNKYTSSIKNNSLSISANIVHSLPDILRKTQECFATTGGVHATALFSQQGKPIYLYEDVGRHNAMDKTIGKSLQEKQIPLTNFITVLSGRISFELVQKAAMAGVPCIVAIGAPSSLAIELAQKIGITLIGFTRKNSYNIYSFPERVI